MVNEERNKKVVLILGGSGTGKTYSIKELINREGERVAYINLDGKTRLGFKGKSKISKFITPGDPLEVNQGVRSLEEDDSIEYIIIDTLSFYLDQIEQKHVIFEHDSQGAWGKTYAAQVKDLLHFANNVSKKSWIFMSHVQEGEIKNFITPTKAYAKGAVGRLGVEAYFDTVLFTNVFDDETAEDGLGYRFQTRKSRETKGFSVKSPEGMFPDMYTESNSLIEVFERIEDYDEED